MATFTSNTQLMENAFPAGPLKLNGHFCVVEDENGEHMIFSVDSQSHLCLVLKAARGQNELIDLSQSLEIPPTHSVRTFAVSQNHNGIIHLVFSVQRPGLADLLYVLQPMAPRASDWSNASLLRQGLFQGPQWDREIREILLGTSNDHETLKNALKRSKDASRADRLAYPQAYLVVSSTDKLTEDIWTVSIDANAKTWAKQQGVTMTTNAEEIVDKTVGNIGDGDGVSRRGLFVLFRETGKQGSLQLRFIGVDVTAPAPVVEAVPLDIPPGARYLSSIENKAGYTDLLVGGDNLYWMAAEDCWTGVAEPQKVDCGIQMANVKQLLIAQSRSTLSLWTLDLDALLSYQEFSVVSEGLPTPQTPAIPLMSQANNSDRFAALYNTEIGQKLFVIGQDGSMKMLEQSRRSGLWQSPLDVMLPESSGLVQFLSYTTFVRAKDESGILEIHRKVRLCCSTSAELLVNGITIRGSPEGAIVETDDMGSLTVISRVDGIASPTVTLYFLDARNKPLVSSAHVIEPTKGVWDLVDGVDSAQDLKNLKLADGTPFVRKGISDEDLSKAAQALKDLRVIRKDFTISDHVPQTSSTFLTRQGSAADWGSWYWIKEQIDIGSEWALKKVKNGWEFVVKIAGQIWKWVLENLPQVTEALQQVLTAISEGWDWLKQKLEVVIGWNDILEVKNVLSNLTTQSILWVADGASNLEDLANDFMQDLRDQVALYKASKQKLPDQLIGEKIRTMAGHHQRSNNEGLETMTNSPAAQYGVYHMKHSDQNKDAEITGEGVVFNRIVERLRDVFAEIGAVVSGFEKNLQSVFEKQDLTLEILLDSMGLDLLDGLLGVMQKFVSAILGSISDITILLADVMNRSIHIPVLSPLYKTITKDSDLSFLDAICLVLAIPATHVYKMITKKSPGRAAGLADWTKPDQYKAELQERMAKTKSSSSRQISKSVALQELPLPGQISRSVVQQQVTPPGSKVAPQEIASESRLVAMVVSKILFGDFTAIKSGAVIKSRFIQGLLDCVAIIKVVIPVGGMIYWSGVKFPKAVLQVKNPVPSVKSTIIAAVLYFCKLGGIVVGPVKMIYSLYKTQNMQVWQGFNDSALKHRLQMWVVSGLALIGPLGGDYGVYVMEIAASVLQIPLLARMHIQLLPGDYSEDLAWEEWFKLIGNTSLAVSGLTHAQDYYASQAISLITTVASFKLQLDRMEKQQADVDWAAIAKRSWDSDKRRFVISADEMKLDLGAVDTFV